MKWPLARTLASKEFPLQLKCEAPHPPKRGFLQKHFAILNP